MTISDAIRHCEHDLGTIPHHRHFPLAKYTTFALGGPADILALPRNEEELLHTLKVAHKHEVPVFILGGGSNIVISDAGIRGMVITLDGDFNKMEVQDSGREIHVGTAVPYPTLTKQALDLGWQSALGWTGTPGQVGGALIMNAGTRLGEIGDTVVRVFAVDNEKVLSFEKNDIGFEYRKTSFPKDIVLTKAILRYEHPHPEKGPELRAQAKEMLLKRKSTQPKSRCAGSIFKNPLGDFAGRLIESCGLKGTTIGGAQVSEVHANFLVNMGNATAQDVYHLANHVKSVVKEKTGTKLEFEVKFIGSFL